MKPTPHTPTPWTLGRKGSTLHIESPSEGYTIALIESPTDLVYCQDDINAAFIVRAVNAHEEMLEALKTVRAIAEAKAHTKLQISPLYLLAIVDGAIARAEGKEA